MGVSRDSLRSLVYFGLLFVAVALAYSMGLQNELVFDDARLTDGSIFGIYDGFFQLKARSLSYGSFVWGQEFARESIPLQRAVNAALHFGVCCAVYQLFALLLPRIVWGQLATQDTVISSSQRAALMLGVTVFALHPVAVYAAGYLVQRSIVMATLFSVLACWAFAKGAIENRLVWFFVAVVFYGLAVLSKEHAFLIAGLAFPIYIFVARPPMQRTISLLLIVFLLLGAIATVLVRTNPNLLGQLFDERSRDLAAQLEMQRPGALSQIYLLSVLNEAALFFYYGALWFLPYPGWMSIDMRPPFPLVLSSVPHLLGATAYVSLAIASLFALLRKSDVWGFLGLCLLFPLILFWTEFATVWVQDPFVLYRSYLWAIPIPALIAVLLTGLSAGTLYKLSVVVALVLGTAATDRLQSMRNSQTVWKDVMDKTDIPGNPAAVGRARSFMNHGMEQLRRSELDLAMRDFRAAQELGALKGEALFAMGMTLQAARRPSEALKLLNQAGDAGYSDNVLDFHRGESQYALGLFADAVSSYTMALAKPLAEVPKEQALAQRADGFMRLERFSEAKSDFELLLTRSPKNQRYLMGGGLSRLGLKDAKGALEMFDAMINEQPTALGFYGRALALQSLSSKASAQEAIGKAVEMEPGNAVYRQVQESIRKGEKLSL
jgi:tetratricopeptide (TPR) repeat protein